MGNIWKLVTLVVSNSRSDYIQGHGEERKEEKESTKSQEKEKIRDTFMVSLFVCMQNAEWHFLPYFFCKKIIKGEIAYG